MAHNYTTTNIYTLSINGQEYKIKTVPFHATEEEWELIDYIPKNGELIVYDEDLNHANKRFKFGDGQLKANQLSFVSSSEASQQIQANWSQTDETKPDFIKNKPSFSAGNGLAIEQKENDIKVKFNEDAVLIFDGGGADFSKYPKPVITDNENGQTADVSEYTNLHTYDNTSGGQTIVV